MSDKPELNKDDATIGMSGDGEVCIMTIPLKKWVDNEADGNALIYGKMRELQAHVMQIAQAMRRRKNDLGVVKPTNGVVPNLSVQ